MKNSGNLEYSTENNGFLRNISGSTSVQFALIISAVAIAVGLAIPVAIESNSQLLALNRSNIDYSTTSSITPIKRYNVRKSILDNNQTNPFPE